MAQCELQLWRICTGSGGCWIQPWDTWVYRHCERWILKVYSTWYRRFEENSLQTVTQDAPPIVTEPTIHAFAVSINCIYSHQPQSNVLCTVNKRNISRIVNNLTQLWLFMIWIYWYLIASNWIKVVMLFICKYCIHNKRLLRMMYKNQNK